MYIQLESGQIRFRQGLPTPGTASEGTLGDILNAVENNTGETIVCVCTKDQCLHYLSNSSWVSMYYSSYSTALLNALETAITNVVEEGDPEDINYP